MFSRQIYGEPNADLKTHQIKTNHSLERLNAELTLQDYHNIFNKGYCFYSLLSKNNTKKGI